MARKPPLTIVNPATVSIQPPFILGKNGRSLWDRIQADYDVSDSAGIELLAQACAAADLAEQLSEEIQTRRPGGAQPWCNPRTSCGQGHDRRQKFCRTNTDQARHQFRASARLCWPTDMSTKRRIIDRERKQGITPEAVAAWMACDWDALHCALGLNIWERSPLPREISGMGCSEDDLPEDADSSDAPLWVKGLKRSLEL
jgi:hypothetical protein